MRKVRFGSYKRYQDIRVQKSHGLLRTGVRWIQ